MEADALRKRREKENLFTPQERSDISDKGEMTWGQWQKLLAFYNVATTENGKPVSAEKARTKLEVAMNLDINTEKNNALNEEFKNEYAAPANFKGYFLEYMIDLEDLPKELVAPQQSSSTSQKKEMRR